MQTIESYLVSLGFQVNQPELAKFQGTLQGVAKVVDQNTSGIIKDFLKLQIAVTGAFLAVGTGAIAMVDKVAMADQTYRLMGMQMFMSKNAAQSFDIALKSLGATMDQVAWDPELNGRFVELLELQDKLQKSLGSDFEKNMVSIRDLRMEWSKFTIEMQYLSYSVVNDLFNKLGLGSGSLLDKLKEFNGYIVGHMPEITNAINNVLVPALKDAWDILVQFVDIGKEAWVTFQQIVGVLSGDDSLSGTATNMETISTTLHHVADGAKDFLDAMMSVEKVVAHLALALADIGTGHFREAAGEIAAAFKSVTPGGGAVIGAGTGITLGGAFGTGLGAELGAGVGAVAGFGIADAVTIPLGAAAGGALGGMLGSGAGGFGGGYLGHWLGSGAAQGIAGMAGIAKAISDRTGIPAELIYGQMMHETGGGSHIAASHNYSGIRDPKTGKYREFESDDSYANYLGNMYTDQKYASTGLLAARNAHDFATDLKKAGYFEDSVSNYERGIERNEKGYASAVSVGTINIIVPKPNATAQDIAVATRSEIEKIQTNSTVRAQANVVGIHQ